MGEYFHLNILHGESFIVPVMDVWQFCFVMSLFLGTQSNVLVCFRFYSGKYLVEFYCNCVCLGY